MSQGGALAPAYNFAIFVFIAINIIFLVRYLYIALYFATKSLHILMN